jgi:polysaccharide biosynthesis protein PelF
MTQTATRAVATPPPSASETLEVLLITESGFPYRVSGVSTWCQNLLAGLAKVEFKVLALVGEPDATPIYPIPKNLGAVYPVPLWGTREALEHRRDLGVRDLWQARRGDHDGAVEERLVPELRAFVAALFAEEPDPVQLAAHVAALHRFFLTTDFDSSMRTEAVWEAFLSTARDQYPAAARRAGYRQAPLALSDVVTGLHWLYHWLLPIAQPLPAVDVAHAAMAGACTLPAVAMKLQQGCGFVFSEHGIYLRETYLLESSDRGSLFLKLLRIGFARRMTEVSYALADEITSCCEYNTRWAARTGATPERVSVVYYGLEPTAFAPAERTDGSRPVVAWMGRVDPVKDLETLLQAAAIVHAARGDVVFRLHGSAAPGQEAYLERVLGLRHELGLDDTVEMAGHTQDPQHAYDAADVVVLSSISEGFPYATLEAMLCAKPVVATAVGGVSEQLADCGILVEPKHPQAMARSLLELLDDPERARRLGRAARNRVQELFDLESKNRRYLELYRSAVAKGADAPKSHPLVAGAPSPPASVPDSPELTALVDQVKTAVPHPVDELEIAAVIEAGGTNDELARRLGAGDVFAVGREVLTRLRSMGPPEDLRPHDIVLPKRPSQPISDLVRGILLLLPAAAVLLASHYLRDVAGWTSGTGRALLLGLTISTMLANGFSYGIVRRGSLLIGCGRWDASRRFLRRSAGFVALGLLALETIGILLAYEEGVPGAELTTFALCFSALVVFWIACTALMFLERTYEAGVAVVIGVAIGFLTDHLVAASSPRHLEIAILVGYLVTVAGVTLRSVTAWPRQRGVANRYRRPAAAYVVTESLPYFGYGSLLIALLLGPIVLTAFLGTSASTSASDLTSIEVGMTLALAPIMVSLYAAGGGLRRFWVNTSRAMSATPACDGQTFAGRLHNSHRSARFGYLLGLVVISLASVPVLWALADTGSLHVFGVRSTSLVTWAFAVSLCSYGLLASGQFDAAVPFTFAGPKMALSSLAAGALAAAVVAAVLFALGEPEVGFVSLLVGSAAFAVFARSRNRSFFRKLIFYYVSSM